MPLTENAKDVIERPLPKESIKQRPGGGGMTFDYVSPAFVTSLLNEAFEYRWNTRIVSHAVHGDTALVCLELKVWDSQNNPISKEQFGSCDVKRGMGFGDAFKGASSDALKKAASLFGVALQLYGDDVPEQGFKRPTASTKTAVPSPAKTAAPTQSTAPSTRPPAPKPIFEDRPVLPKPNSPPAANLSLKPPAPVPSAPPKNPFAKNNAPVAAEVSTPPKPTEVSVPKVNPFAAKLNGAGPNATQISALTNLATRKEKTQPTLIALAAIADDMGNPKQRFDDLTHSEAISVIKAAQL